MKHILLGILLLFSLSISAQKTSSKYIQLDYVLYRGGPGISFDSYSQDTLNSELNFCNTSWTANGLSGFPGSLLAAYPLAVSTNTCSSNITTASKIIYSQFPSVYGLWQTSTVNKVSVTPTTICTFIITELVQLWRGRFYQQGPEYVWHTPIMCKEDELARHTIRIVEPISFNTPNIQACSNQPRIDLRTFVNDPSGTFSASAGIEDQYFFNPALVQAGVHTVTYTKIYDNGTIVRSVNINVTAPPIISAGSAQEVCKNSDLVLIALSEGEWTSPYVTSGIFSGTLAPVGTYEVRYTSINAARCTSTTTKVVTVKPLPVVSAGVHISLCSNAPTITLLGGTPTPGIWSGFGVTTTNQGSTFNPAAAQIGSNTISYQYTNPVTGCSAVATKSITVLQAPIVTPISNSTVCANSLPIQLDSYPGATWTGSNAISGNSFNVAAAGIGTYTLTLTVPNSSCTTVVTQVIRVKPLPVIDVVVPSSLCTNGLPITLPTKQGVILSQWTNLNSSSSLSGNTYDPRKETGTTANLRYAQVDTNLCSNTKNFLITINTKPEAQPLTSKGCINQPTITLQGVVPPGARAAWIGNNISGSLLSVAPYGVGTHKIFYTITDARECSDTTDAFVSIFSLPSVYAGKDTAACQGHAPINLNQTPGLLPRGGQWYFQNKIVASSLLDISRLPLGNYYATYQTTDNNTTCSNRDSILISINAVPAQPTVTGKVNYCKGDQIYLSVPFSFQTTRWVDAVTKKELSNSNVFTAVADSNRTINVEYINAFKCPSLPVTAFVVVENSQGGVSISKDTVITGEAIQFTYVGDTARKKFDWTFSNFPFSGVESSPVMYFYTEGSQSYNLTVTTQLGCISTFSKQNAYYVKKKAVNSTTSENGTHYGYSVAQFLVRHYPNPVNDILIIETLNGILTNASYTVYNSLGAIVLEGTNYNRIDMSTQSQGIYTVVMKSSQYNENFVVVKE